MWCGVGVVVVVVLGCSGLFWVVLGCEWCVVRCGCVCREEKQEGRKYFLFLLIEMDLDCSHSVSCIIGELSMYPGLATETQPTPIAPLIIKTE